MTAWLKEGHQGMQDALGSRKCQPPADRLKAEPDVHACFCQGTWHLYNLRRACNTGLVSGDVGRLQTVSQVELGIHIYCTNLAGRHGTATNAGAAACKTWLLGLKWTPGHAARAWSQPPADRLKAETDIHACFCQEAHWC